MAVEPLPELCDRDAWTGGFYELAIQLGPRNDVQMQAALGILAQVADIAGPWHVQWEPDRIRPASWSVADLETAQLRGQFQLPDGRQMICSVVGMRLTRGVDWLALCMPLEALGRSDPRVGAFPFVSDYSASLAWRRPIDDWFARLAGEVCARTGFRVAAIGFEVDGWVNAETKAKGLEDREVASYFTASRDVARSYALVLTDGTYLPAGGWVISPPM